MPSKNSTSTTPVNRPTLMSSDKMSNTAPVSMRFTVQQLSRYFGLRSFKISEVLHDVCQPNFSFIKPSNAFLELGQVANIKKSQSNKTPIEWPDKFLEVVHCDIGYRDCKSIGNGALKSSFQQWITDCGGSPSRLYTDFDPKILDGPTASFLATAIFYFELLPVAVRIKTVLLNTPGRQLLKWQGLL